MIIQDLGYRDGYAHRHPDEMKTASRHIALYPSPPPKHIPATCHRLKLLI